MWNKNEIQYGDTVEIVAASCGCCSDFIGKKGKVIRNASSCRVEVEGLGYSTFDRGDLKLIEKRPDTSIKISIPRKLIDPHLYK